MEGAIIKTNEEIENIRKAGKILAQIYEELRDMAKLGIASWALEEKFIELCKSYEVRPSCKGYSPANIQPFPTGLCLGVNDQSVHCYPQEGITFKEGDLIKLDTIIEYKKVFVDSAITIGIGDISKENQKLINTTRKALMDAISVIEPGVMTGVISNTIGTIAENNGYSVLTDYAGHGVGRQMHEPPDIPCYGEKTSGIKMEPGMVLAIEPLICEKNNKLRYNNEWETRTVDGGNFVQFEHSVLVTQTGHEILTEI